MRNNLNFAFISKVLISLGLLILSGCSTTVETYHPGYYQEGQWETGGYQPAYYDVYGNLHPAKQVQAYYEEGEWHRPYVTTTQIKGTPMVTPTGKVVDPLATAVVVPGDVNATLKENNDSSCHSCFD